MDSGKSLGLKMDRVLFLGGEQAETMARLYKVIADEGSGAIRYLRTHGLGTERLKGSEADFVVLEVSEPVSEIRTGLVCRSAPRF